MSRQIPASWEILHARCGSCRPLVKLMTDRIYLSPPHGMTARKRGSSPKPSQPNFIAPAGPALGAFEREFSERTGFAHCVALSSGTAAMHLALKGLDLQPGEEVWASTLTFIASIGPAVHERATPVFIDSDEDTWTMDPVLLEEGLARRETGQAPARRHSHGHLRSVLRPRPHRRHLSGL